MLFQKHLFLHQLTHNMTKDCSWNYHENFKRRTWPEHGQNMFCAWGNSLVIRWTICFGLINSKIRASDKDLPVIMEDLHLLLTPIDQDQWPGVNRDPQRVNSDLQWVNSDLQRDNLEIIDLYLANLQIIDLHLANSEIIDLQLASVIQINR